MNINQCFLTLLDFLWSLSSAHLWLLVTGYGLCLNMRKEQFDQSVIFLPATVYQKGFLEARKGGSIPYLTWKILNIINKILFFIFVEHLVTSQTLRVSQEKTCIFLIIKNIPRLGNTDSNLLHNKVDPY